MSDEGLPLKHHELVVVPGVGEGEPAAAQFSLRGLVGSTEDSYAGIRSLEIPNAQAASRGNSIDGDPKDRATASEETNWLVSIGIFLLAAVPRAITIFLLTGADYLGVGWYQDAFHHWQIAYLSKEIGFSQGFLRLWDFKGMEYFWGVAHPLVTASAFAATGSIDMLIPRLIGLITGSVAVLLLFLLARRYFGSAAAWGVAILSSLNPVVLTSDTAGVQEPIGLMLLFAGLYFWPDRRVMAGISLALAGTVRADYWVFGFGLAVASVIVDRHRGQRGAILFGWLLPTAAYMAYLGANTGNPLYPVYWYFRGNAMGEWTAEVPTGPVTSALIWISRLLLPLAILAAIRIVRSKAPSALFALLGIGSAIYLLLVFGFSAFARLFSPHFLVDRIFVLPHIYLGALAGIALLSSKPRRRLKLWVGAVGIAALALVSQAMWFAIRHYAEPWDSFLTGLYDASSEIAATYRGGVISIPEDRPEITYFLARYHGIPASALQSQMYDAFAYIDGDPFADYPATEPKLRQWLSENNIRLLVMYSDDPQYAEMIDRNPDWFTFAGFIMDGRMHLFWVHPGSHGISGQSGERAIAK